MIRKCSGPHEVAADYRVQVTVKNGLLWHAIRAAGYDSVAGLCRAMGAPGSSSQGMVGELLAMRASPVKRNGEWRLVVLKIAEATKTIPDVLFNDEHMRCTKTNEVEFDMDSADVERLIDDLQSANDPSLRLELKDLNAAVDAALHTLNERERDIISSMYGIDCEQVSLHDLAEKHGVTTSRLRKIEAVAMRKLREPIRSGKLRDAWSGAPRRAG